jgi:Kef-type K+ transport system membrane component KefB
VGEIRDGLLVAITLMATSLGVLVPILKDLDQTDTAFGRLIMAAGSVAELAPLILLSVFFSAASTNPSVELGLLAGFVAFTAAIVVLTERIRVWTPLRAAVQQLENTSSQLRVRLAITLALAFGVVAQHFGLAMILGAFLAGVIVRRTEGSDSSVKEFEGKLDAIGFGFLIPVFFVSTGVLLDVTSLFNSSRAMAAVPIFLAALLVVRGLPAILYVPVVGRTRAVAAGFMQATSLPFIVVATTIGVATDHQRPSTAAALVVAGLLSVIIYPPAAMLSLRGDIGPATEAPSLDPPSTGEELL